MGVVVGLVAGYALGQRSAKGNTEELRRSLRGLLETEEMADVAAAVRAELGAGLRALAAAVDGGGPGEEGSGDLVARVTHLADRGSPDVRR
jgi:hypothetical protein